MTTPEERAEQIERIRCVFAVGPNEMFPSAPSPSPTTPSAVTGEGMTPEREAEIRRYVAGSPTPGWQVVFGYCHALLAEVDRLRASGTADERLRATAGSGVDQEGSTTRTESTRDAMMRLAQFGAWAIRELRDDDNLGADLDGGSAQDEALRLGVLVTVRMSEPCGEGCACLEYDEDFPTDCYRYPAEITQALRALMLTERAPVPAVDPSRSTPTTERDP